MTLWEELQWRGFYYQCTNDTELQKKFEKEKITAYVGVDPTGESLHIGHFVPLYLMCHFYQYGHVPIIVLGSGTAKIGDPSGKSKIRPILSVEELEKNTKKIENQIQLIFSRLEIKAQFIDNSKWLDKLQYLSFLRDIGKYFSVNRMLSFETYKKRLETGLNFLEFNYQLLQSYDFLYLFEKYQCTLQFGGADQWANIVAGSELIKKVHAKECFGYTLPLVTRSDGTKMGKTEDGAIFIDSNLTNTFDFYQYWRNVDDRDCIKFLKLYTFLSKEEIIFWGNLKDQELNIAKELLAYYVTTIIHGEDIAWNMLISARSMFSQEKINKVIEHILVHNKHVLSNESIDLLNKIINIQNSITKVQHIIPTIQIERETLKKSISIIDIFLYSKLCSSKSEVRRLIQQGGARLFDAVVSSIDMVIDETYLSPTNDIIVKSGKKKIARLQF